MTTNELRAKIDEYREELRAHDGDSVLMSESGPVGMVLIEAIADLVELQERRIRALEMKLGL